LTFGYLTIDYWSAALIGIKIIDRPPACLPVFRDFGASLQHGRTSNDYLME
jgi:hypothetical protein